MRKSLRAGMLLFLTCATVIVAAPQSNLDQQIAELSRQISNEIIENRKTKIAVVEFTNIRGEVNDIGRLISEELITRLYQTKKFRVIERQMLNKVISEQKLSLTGTIDPRSAQRLGELLGVDAIVSGTFTDLGQNLRVNARLIGTQTGEIFAAASAQVLKSSLGNLVEGSDSAPSSSNPKPSQLDGMEVKAQLFTFKLLQCRLSGTSVVCDLQITNDDKDRVLSLSTSGTRLFDDSGNQVQVREIRLANEKVKSPFIYVNSLLVSGVPTRARILFEDIPSQATKISLLEIQCVSDRGFYIRFRNVCLTEPCSPGTERQRRN